MRRKIMIESRWLFKQATALIVVTALFGCGGGGSGAGGGVAPDVQGLNMAKTMSVVTAQNEGGFGVLVNNFQGGSVTGVKVDFAGAAQALAAESDYNTDETHTYVWDESMESLKTVNMILCLMDQTRASEMVNKGAYIALVNEEKCEQGKNQSSAGTSGQSSGGKTVKYNKWTILSARADNNSPQYVKIWVPGEPNSNDPDEAQTILVDVTAFEGVSPTKPYGHFKMNFKGVVDAGGFGGSPGNEALVMKGTLETIDNVEDKPQFRFIDIGGTAANPELANFGANFSLTEAANVILDDVDGNNGKAKTYSSFSDGQFSEEGTYALSFNTSNLLRGKDDDNDNIADTQMCLSRTSYNTQVWRYNLYRSTDGSRVELNSGFPFRYDTGSSEVHGHVSYWGLWIEEGVTIADGATIVKQDYQSESSANYTVNIAPGKLIRRTANQVALSDYNGDQFYTWAQHPTFGYPQPNYDSWVVTISNGEFVITHGVKWGNGGPQQTDVTDGNVSFGFTGENLMLWSDALGGNVVYVHDPNVQVANRQVTYYKEEFVHAGDGTLLPGGATSAALYCYDRCLKGSLTQTDVDGAGSVDDLYYDPNGGPYNYLAEVSAGKLLVKDHLGKTVSADGLSLSNLAHDWGINTGEMVIDTSGINNPWDVYNQPVSYRWETGSNSWNKLVTVRDDHNSLVVFDRPMTFSYTHSQANDANDDAAHAGKTFLLQYGGPGELWGFPWEQQGERWYSSVTLKDGVILNDGSDSYLVKAIEKELTMKSDPSGCGTLDISSLFTDPNLDLPTASDIGDVSITLAGKPIVTKPPAVIEGQLQ
jgi:hypothetical protein